VSAPDRAPAQRKTASLYVLLLLDGAAVWFLIVAAMVVYDTENTEPSVAYPILAAVAAASLLVGGGLLGARGGRPRALTVGLLLVPVLAVLLAWFFPWR